MTTATRTRTSLYNLLGSEVRLNPAMHGLGLAFGTYRQPYLVGRLQNVDASFAYLTLADGTETKVFVEDIFEATKA